ncbi:MAG: hypothetical protein LBF88_04455 [Planctomycetaceae bacterium]|nr:hypothetical protein [Planctomycetaceae bacterium]
MLPFCLFILCFIVLVPDVLGVLFSLVLREIYRRKLWEKENMAKQESETPQDNVVVKLYDPSMEEEISGEMFNDEMNTEPVQNEQSGVMESEVAENAVEGAVENTVENTVGESVESVVGDATVLDSEPNTELDTIPIFPEVPEIIPTEIPETSELISAPETQSFPDEFRPQFATKPKERETNLSSVFDNQNMLQNTFRLDDVLDEMVNGNPPIIPADLSLRLEEDGNPENRINQMEKENNEDGLELDEDENEILAKIADSADFDSNNLSFLQPNISFNREAAAFNQAENNEENLDAVHSDISPMAVELLGKDFNFNSFFEEQLKHKKVREEPIMISEPSPGIYQADGGFINVTNNRIMRELLPKEQEVVSLYSDHLVQNAVIEPDSSETAQELSFTEESLPMFVRKKNRKQ